MIRISSGEFQMGSTMGAIVEYCNLLYGNSPPIICSQDMLESMYQVNEGGFVSVRDFYIDRFEVSVASYLDCVEADVCNVYPIEHEYYSLIENPNLPTNLPVAGITYYDAAVYCAWREGRLPTEPEWEYAASGSEGNPFPWGDEISTIPANYCDASCSHSLNASSDDGFAEIAPVDSFEAGQSWAGVYNLAGNVSEWTSTKLEIGEGLVFDIRIVKGGNYNSGIHELLTWMRLPNSASIAQNIGFRCVRTTQP